jgi:chromosome segregation ATPase
MGERLKLAVACIAGRAEQLRQLIKNRERDIEELTKRLAFMREQISSANEEISSLEAAVAYLVSAPESAGE